MKNSEVKRETTIEIPSKNNRGCTIQAKTIFWTVLWCAICSIAVKECKRADIRLEQEKIKLEQLKKDSSAMKTSDTNIDTLKIENYQKEYVPLLKMYQQNNKQK